MVEEEANQTWLKAWTAEVPTLPAEKSGFFALPPEKEIVLSLVRWAIKHRDFSERSLSLTDKAISLNSADYNAWWLRRQCLEHLPDRTVEEIEDEHAFCTDWIDESPKTYQAWHHRSWLFDMCFSMPLKYDRAWLDGYLERDVQHCDGCLTSDSKNHCAWQYRQHIMKTAIAHKMRAVESEMEFICNHIIIDCWNNSAWNYRHWMFEEFSSKTRENVDAEIDFAIHWIKKSPRNETPYNYLMSFLTGKGAKLANLGDQNEQIVKVQQALDDLKSFRVDQHLPGLAHEIRASVLSSTPNNSELVQGELETSMVCDPIRAEYYSWLSENMMLTQVPVSSNMP